MDKPEWKRIYCNRFLLDLKFCPLENHFSPLATHSEIPILAGETLYPSAEHYVAAQLFRDVGRLEAAVNVPKIRSQRDLRQYIRNVLSAIDESLVVDWRHTKMLSALKTATHLKFSQYAELKALLVQTGNAILIETCENDADWGIGMSFEKLNKLMETESLSIASVAFWLMHCDFKPGILGANITGRLLMMLRNEILIEFDKESKQNIGPDVYVCKICSNLNTPNSSIYADADEIMFINAPNSVVSFSYPSIFVSDGKMYLSVDDYVTKKCEELKTTINVSKSVTTLDSIEDEIFSLYEKAVETNLRQNRFAREALIRTKSSLLVDVRPVYGRKDVLVNHLCFNLGAFNGDISNFVTYVDDNLLSTQALARCWLNSGVPRLKAIGKNRLGLLLMKSRDKLLIQQNYYTETIKSDSLRLHIAIHLGELNRELLLKTEDFTTRDKIMIIHQENKRNPLNKFFTTLFTVDKVDVISLEHYFWLRRTENVVSGNFRCQILSTNNATELKDMCEMWAASNTPVVDEGQISDSDIYDQGCFAKFEQNCSLAAYLLQHFELFVDGNDSEIEIMNQFVAKWKIPVRLLLYWWRGQIFSKPPWLMDNLHGLALMKTRQKLVDTYFSNEFHPKTEFLNFDSFKTAAVINKTSFYVFTDNDLLGMRSKLSRFVFEDVEYLNILRFYWFRCFDELGLTCESKRFLSADDNFECETFAEETIQSSNLLNNYAKWRTENELQTLKDAIKNCVQCNENFRQELLATDRLILIYASESKELGVGMDKSKFAEFIGDLNLEPGSFAKLYLDILCKPENLGGNLWASLLMESRTELLNEVSSVQMDTSHCPDCILKVENVKKTYFSDKQDRSECKRIDDSQSDNDVCSWDNLISPFSHLFKVDPEEKKTANVFDESVKVESVLDKKKLALLSSFRQCFPNFSEMISSVRNDEDAFKLGQLFAVTFEQLFGNQFELAVNTFSFEDLHNLGRIAGLEQKFT